MQRVCAACMSRRNGSLRDEEGCRRASGVLCVHSAQAARGGARAGGKITQYNTRASGAGQRWVGRAAAATAAVGAVAAVALRPCQVQGHISRPCILPRHHGGGCGITMNATGSLPAGAQLGARTRDGDLELAGQEELAVDGLRVAVKVGAKPVEGAVCGHLGVLLAGSGRGGVEII